LVNTEPNPSPAGDIDDLDSDDPETEEEVRRLSIPRVMTLIVIVIALVGATGLSLKRAVAGTPNHTAVAQTWFAPYVDATLTPTYEFQSPIDDPARQVVLGFVVASKSQPCQPTWGTYYTLAQAATTLNLDRRIAQVRSNGGEAIVSFGGQANSELADSCTDTTALENAYRSVISRYQSTTVDFDLEGQALDDQAGIERRAEALARIQQTTRAAGKHLSIWLTLPSEPSGLADNALSIVATMVKDGVDVAGVNVMTMDFTGPEGNMLTAAEDALTAAHRQVAQVYRSYGIKLTATETWNKIGATPMIGQNDTDGEVFDQSDAAGLVTFAQTHHLGRVSMWSLNRDRRCGSEFAELDVHSDACSGTAENTLGFTDVLDRLAGTAQVAAADRTALAFIPNPIDNPATSPYPIWQPGTSYVSGYKVVREGYVYQAKWYNQGDDPAEQTQYSYETPWELVGPVLPGEHAPKVKTLPAGTYPAWSPKTPYTGGSEVLRNGLPYTAKYYNQGDDPLAAAEGSADSPWVPAYTVPGEPSTAS
jgi:chitinase